MSPREKRARLEAAEQAGGVADNLDVRRALLGRVKSGELSLEQAQAELAAIKRGARGRGLSTRGRAWSGK